MISHVSSPDPLDIPGEIILGDADGPADAAGRQLTLVDQAPDGARYHAEMRGDLVDLEQAA